MAAQSLKVAVRATRNVVAAALKPNSATARRIICR